MNEQAIRFRIGIFVLAALILLGVLIILFGGLPNYFKSSTNYTISFANAQGISAGTPVKRSGVKIGEVSRVALNNDTGKVEVHIQVDEGFTLRKGDRPTVVKELLGGDTSISFMPPEGQEVDKTPVAPGAVLIGFNQADASTLVQKGAEVMPSAQEALDEIKKVFQKIDKDVLPALTRTTAKLEDFTDKTGKIIPELSKTLPEITKTFQTINKDLVPKIADFVDKTEKVIPDVQKTFQDINKNVLPELAKTLPTINDFADKTGKKIDDFMDKTEKVLPDIQKTFQSVNKDLIPDLRKTNDEAQVAIRNFGKLAERADNLLQANEEKLTKTIDRVQETLRRVAEVFNDDNQKAIHDILKNVRTTSDRFDGMARNADDFIKDGRGTLKRFNESLATIEEVLGDVQKATKPLAERSASIAKNLDESTDKLNRTLADVHELVQMVSHGDGTIQRLLSDPSVYNNLNEASCSLSKILPRVDRIMRDVEIFADKIARHPESLGIGGVVRPSSGLKDAPTPYKIIPVYP